MADIKAAKAHIEEALKHLRESSAASFAETYVARAIQSLDHAFKSLSSDPAPAPAAAPAAKPVFETGTPVPKK